MKTICKLNIAAALLILSILILSACSSKKDAFINENVDFAAQQTKLMLDATGQANGKNYPRTTVKDGELRVTNMYDWTPGFFPGSLWYLFELSEDPFWQQEAEEWTRSLEPLKTFTQHHDLGFMMYCSYGNAMRLSPKEEYKDILIESSKSLTTRYSDTVECIKSWNGGREWNDSITWKFPVIIDNMMNLELLFYGTKASGDNTTKDIAIKHANTTLRNHFRDDHSSYHVVDYDPETGEVRRQVTAQGYSDNSTWARGQAWAIYGYTMTGRETNDKKYIEAATKMTDWYLNHLPEDLIPLWDFNTGQEGYVPGWKSHASKFKGEKQKDVSAAAIVCSALFELGQITNNKTYIDAAEKMLHTLASPEYRAELGTNGNFILKHSVGSIPHNTEIDVPLVYADYYFLEALCRYKAIK